MVLTMTGAFSGSQVWAFRFGLNGRKTGTPAVSPCGVCFYRECATPYILKSENSSSCQFVALQYGWLLWSCDHKPRLPPKYYQCSQAVLFACCCRVLYAATCVAGFSNNQEGLCKVFEKTYVSFWFMPLHFARILVSFLKSKGLRPTPSVYTFWTCCPTWSKVISCFPQACKGVFCWKRLQASPANSSRVASLL